MSSRRHHAWAFLLPTCAVLWSGRLTDGAMDTGAALCVAASVCVASGAAWQLLDRRDLTDRLTYVAAGFVVLVLLYGVLWEVDISAGGPFMGLVGVITGSVYAEQWLRGRDRHRAGSERRVTTSRIR